MSGGAKVSMILGYGLSPAEQQKVDAIEGDVVNYVLTTLRSTLRPLWSSAGGDGHRVIRLNLGESTLVEIPEHDFAAMSPEDVLSRVLTSA